MVRVLTGPLLIAVHLAMKGLPCINTLILYIVTVRVMVECPFTVHPTADRGPGNNSGERQTARKGTGYPFSTGPHYLG